MVIRLHNDSGDSIRIVVKQVPAVLSTLTLRRVKKALGDDLQGLRATGPDRRSALIMPTLIQAGVGAGQTLMLPGPFYTCAFCGVQGQDTVGSGRGRRWCSESCRAKAVRRARWAAKKAAWADWHKERETAEGP